MELCHFRSSDEQFRYDDTLVNCTSDTDAQALVPKAPLSRRSGPFAAYKGYKKTNRIKSSKALNNAMFKRARMVLIQERESS